MVFSFGYRETVKKDTVLGSDEFFSFPHRETVKNKWFWKTDDYFYYFSSSPSNQMDHGFMVACFWRLWSDFHCRLFVSFEIS